jgi:aryl-alcohol dehydrogenase-like predicted oxidoreductase
MYADCETLLGKYFKHRPGAREKVFLVTKFGMIKGSITEIDSSGAYAKQACDASLGLLGVDSIDLYYAHRVNANTPIEETMRALVELKAAGKIKHIGLCEVSSATLRRACAVAHVDAVQAEYSLFERGIESIDGPELLSVARELGVAVVAYSPLGRGLLTGAITTAESISGKDDLRSLYMPRFQGENLRANIKVVEELKKIADRKGCTAAQLAIAWVGKQGVIPIPGTKKIKYLEENWGALKVELSDAEEKEIRSLVEGGNNVAGERAVDFAKPQFFVDTIAEE